MQEVRSLLPHASRHLFVLIPPCSSHYLQSRSEHVEFQLGRPSLPFPSLAIDPLLRISPASPLAPMESHKRSIHYLKTPIARSSESVIRRHLT